METLIIELFKSSIPPFVALLLFWLAQKRAKSLGVDDAAEQYEKIQEKLKAALHEDLAETKEDFLQCKNRLITAEQTIESLRDRLREQDQTIFNLRSDISKLQSQQRLRNPSTRGRKTDGPSN